LDLTFAYESVVSLAANVKSTPSTAEKMAHGS